MSGLYRPPQSRGAASFRSPHAWADVSDSAPSGWADPAASAKAPSRSGYQQARKAYKPVHEASSSYATGATAYTPPPNRRQPPTTPPPINGPTAATLRRERRQRASAKVGLTETKTQAVAEFDSSHGAPRRGPPTRHPRKGQVKGTAPATASASVEALADALRASSGETRRAALEAVCASVLTLSFDPGGCRVVQTALETADLRVGEELVAGLHGHVWEAVVSPHANYVIQRLIEVMPTAQAFFVTLELKDKGATVARHRYGCRILCRLLEHSAHEPGTMALVDEVVAEAVGLSRHAFGHHVIQSTFEHGTPAQLHKLVEAIRADLPRNAQNRNSTYVIEKALSYCSDEDRNLLVEDLLEDDQLVALAQHQFGCFVIRALFKLPGDVAQRTVAQLAHTKSHLETNKHGLKLLYEAGLSTAQRDPGVRREEG